MTNFVTSPPGPLGQFRRLFNGVAGCTATLLMLCESGAAQAEELCSSDEMCLELYIIDASFKTVFDELSRQSQQRIDLGEQVHGRINAMRLQGDAEDAVSQVSQAYGLDWFKFNGVIYVSDVDSAVSRVVRLGNLPYTVAQSAIESAGLDTPAFRMASASEGKAAVLTGPPKMVAFGEVILESLHDPLSSPPSVADTIRVRRGNYISNEPLFGYPPETSGSDQPDLAEGSAE